MGGLQSPAVSWRQDDSGVGVIELASPPANALSSDVLGGLEEALALAHSARVRAVVLASSVPRFFAAGADLKLLSGVDRDGFRRYLDRLCGVLDAVASAPFVTIAALDGMALGGGLELAMAATLRVAGAGARMGLPEIKLGLLPGAGGTQRLPALVGRGRALDLLLTGRTAPASEAAALGLVDRLVDDGTALDAALALAAELASYPAPALAAIVRCVDASQTKPQEGMEVEREEVLALFDSPDAREGVTAFVEKRPPRFLHGETPWTSS